MKGFEKFDKPDQDADPHTFSPYSKNIELKKTGYKAPHSSQNYPIHIDPKTGDKYVEKMEKYYSAHQREINRNERFISIFVKGILKSSDFIEKDGRFFSKVIDLDKTSKVKKGELIAELLILKNLFDDTDHLIEDDTEESLTEARMSNLHGEGVEQHHNLVIKGDKFVHFDYGAADFTKFFLNTIEREEDFRESVRDRISVELIDFTLGKDVKDRKEILNQCIEKIQKIRERLLDKKFFSSVVKESKIDLNIFNSSISEKEKGWGLENLRQDLIKKTYIILDVIKDLKTV
jgi:hypothetical protein